MISEKLLNEVMKEEFQEIYDGLDRICNRYR